MTDSDRGNRTGPSQTTVVLLGSGATFLALLDATIANLAVSALHNTFTHSSVADFSWVISLYAVLFAAFLAPAGRLADIVGRRLLFVTGVGLFVAMSLLCALAPTLPLLLIARALQGIAAAAMIPASLSVILYDSPPARRMAFIGVWSAAASVAAAVGPSIGGGLIQVFSWRAVFLINVPVGVLMLIGSRLLPGSPRNRAARPDILGTVALAMGVGGIVLGITQGAAWHWADPRTLSSLIIGALLVAATLWRSTRHPVPAVQIALWRSRTFALANIVSLFFGAAVYAWLLCGALFLVNVWHYTELNAGLALSPGAIFSAISAIGVGRLSGRWRDPRVAVCTGAVLMLATTALLTFYLPAKPHFLALWLPTVLIGGFGVGAMSTGVSSAAALSVMPQQFAAATGLNMAARQVGGALGIGVLAALLTSSGSAQPPPYAHILLFCTITLMLAGISGLGLILRPAAAPAVRTTPATTDVTA